MIVLEIPNFSEIFDKSCIEILKGKEGIYVLIDEFGKELYVGKSIDLYSRVKNHLRHLSTMKRFIKSFKYFEVDNPVDLELYETYLINTLKLPFNCSKVYTYNSYKYRNKYLKEMERSKTVGGLLNHN